MREFDFYSDCGPANPAYAIRHTAERFRIITLAIRMLGLGKGPARVEDVPNRARHEFPF
jgi:hypothetical protein